LRQARGLFCTSRSTKRQVSTFGWRGSTHIAGIDNRLCKSSERLRTEALRRVGEYFPVLRYRRAPQTRMVMPLGCLNLGSLNHPEYHGGGLLPSPLDKTIQVSTPTLFAKPGFGGATPANKRRNSACKGFVRGRCGKTGSTQSLRKVFGFRLSCFILRGGSVSTPKTGSITQFTRRDEEIGG
jgi:hypothetical protein